jgi:hypothetical protein
VCVYSKKEKKKTKTMQVAGAKGFVETLGIFDSVPSSSSSSLLGLPPFSDHQR